MEETTTARITITMLPLLTMLGVVIWPCSSLSAPIPPHPSAATSPRHSTAPPRSRTTSRPSPSNRSAKASAPHKNAAQDFGTSAVTFLADDSTRTANRLETED
jgi:hypothetical protein